MNKKDKSFNNATVSESSFDNKAESLASILSESHGNDSSFDQAAKLHRQQMTDRYLQGTHQRQDDVLEAIRKKNYLEGKIAKLRSGWENLVFDEAPGNGIDLPVSHCQDDPSSEILIVVDTQADLSDFDRYYYSESDTKARQAYLENFDPPGSLDDVSLDQIQSDAQYVDRLTEVVNEREILRFLKNKYDQDSVINFMNAVKELELIGTGAQKIIAERERYSALSSTDYSLERLDQSLDEPITDLDLSFLDLGKELVTIESDEDATFVSSAVSFLEIVEDLDSLSFEDLARLDQQKQDEVRKPQNKPFRQLKTMFEIMSKNDLSQEEYNRAVNFVHQAGLEFASPLETMNGITPAGIDRLLELNQTVESIDDLIESQSSQAVDLLLFDIQASTNTTQNS